MYPYKAARRGKCHTLPASSSIPEMRADADKLREALHHPRQTVRPRPSIAVIACVKQDRKLPSANL